MSPRLPQRPGPMRMNCRLGRSLLSRPTARPTASRSCRSGSSPYCCGIHVDDVRDVGHAAVGDVAVGREDDALLGDVLGDRRGHVLPSALALRPALQQVEVLARRRRTRCPPGGPGSLQGLAGSICICLMNGVSGDQAVEGHDQIVACRDRTGPSGRRRRSSSKTDTIWSSAGNSSPHLLQQLAHRTGLEGVRSPG